MNDPVESVTTDWPKEEWTEYAVALREYANEATYVADYDYGHGTCSYIARASGPSRYGPEPESIDSYGMFDHLSLRLFVAPAVALKAVPRGRKPERIRLAKEIAAYIMENLV